MSWETESVFQGHGIASLGFAVPPYVMSLETLADLRGVDPDKYRFGLGCESMAVPPPDMTPADLGAQAAQEALEHWDGSLDEIGFLAVGTETGMDMSRPVSAWIADALGLSGSVRSYEVKHACYGGTLALRQALEWRASGAAAGKAALVVATDLARYAPESPGEPTQGAGAVAFVVAEPAIAQVGIETARYSEPAFDFWRPVGEPYPRVDGKFSIACYQKAATETFGQWFGRTPSGADAQLRSGFFAHCLHVPFPKMVYKGVYALAQQWDWSDQETETFLAERIEPYLHWNRKIGNAYTASLWFSVAHALAESAPSDRLTAFSYGSGFGAELLWLRRGEAQADWYDRFEAQLAARTELSAEAYLQIRSEEQYRTRAVA